MQSGVTVSGRDIVDAESHGVRVIASSFRTAKSENIDLRVDEDTRHDVKLHRHTAYLIALGGEINRTADNVAERFERNFDRDFASFTRECSADEGTAGFAGGAFVRAPLNTWLFATGDVRYAQNGRADFECAASGPGPPPRTLTIDGSSQFKTITLSFGPAVNVGPFFLGAGVGVTRWQNDYVMEDRLVSLGNQLAGERVEGEESGTDLSWFFRADRTFFGRLMLSAGVGGYKARDAFPENNKRVPRNASRSEFTFDIAYKLFSAANP
jgi:hypothetical protein